MTRLQIAEFTGRYMQVLRRYRRGTENNCPIHGYHNATTEIGETQSDTERGDDQWPHDDKRWPQFCHCGQYWFTDDDHWQNNYVRIFRMPDGSEFQFWGAFGKIAPVGAMIRAPWYDEFSKHPAGIESWLVALPDGGEWITSQAASSGGYWEVSGEPPNITVHPSIWHNQPSGWHGFITNGELVGV